MHRTNHPRALVAAFAALVAAASIALVPLAPAGQCPLVRPANGNQFVAGTPIEVEFERGTLSNPPVLPGATWFYELSVRGEPSGSHYYKEFLDAEGERHFIARNSGTYWIENRYVLGASEIGFCDGNGTFDVVGGPPIPPADGSVYPLPTPISDPAVKPAFAFRSSHVLPGDTGSTLQGVLTRDGSVTYLPDLVIRNAGTAELKLYDLVVPFGGEACRIEPMVSVSGITLQPNEEITVPFVIIRRPEFLHGVRAITVDASVYCNVWPSGWIDTNGRIRFGVWNNAAEVPAGLVPTPSTTALNWEMYE